MNFSTVAPWRSSTPFIASKQFSNVPAVQATQLLNDILTDQSMRDAIAAADIVLVNVGFNDTPWNRLDTRAGLELHRDGHPVGRDHARVYSSRGR
jgi:hypothetical protein